MVGRDCDVNLRLTSHPEFDAWRWHDYWVPLDVVIEFKRDVYQRALQELSRYLARPMADIATRSDPRYQRHLPEHAVASHADTTDIGDIAVASAATIATPVAPKPDHE